MGTVNLYDIMALEIEAVALKCNDLHEGFRRGSHVALCPACRSRIARYLEDRMFRSTIDSIQKAVASEESR